MSNSDGQKGVLVTIDQLPPDLVLVAVANVNLHQRMARSRDIAKLKATPLDVRINDRFHISGLPSVKFGLPEIRENVCMFDRDGAYVLFMVRESPVEGRVIAFDANKHVLLRTW